MTATTLQDGESKPYSSSISNISSSKSSTSKCFTMKRLTVTVLITLGKEVVLEVRPSSKARLSYVLEFSLNKPAPPGSPPGEPLTVSIPLDHPYATVKHPLSITVADLKKVAGRERKSR
jgi:hypothetical protein